MGVYANPYLMEATRVYVKMDTTVVTANCLMPVLQILVLIMESARIYYSDIDADAILDLKEDSASLILMNAKFSALLVRCEISTIFYRLF